LGEITPYGCIMAGEQSEPFWKTKKKEQALRRFKSTAAD